MKFILNNLIDNTIKVFFSRNKAVKIIIYQTKLTKNKGEEKTVCGQQERYSYTADHDQKRNKILRIHMFQLDKILTDKYSLQILKIKINKF